MTKSEDYFGIVLFEGGIRGVVPAKLCGPAESCFDPYSNGPMIRPETVPDKKNQSDYVFGEGPGVGCRKNIVCRLTPEELFDWFKAQICLERIEKQFPEIKSFVVVDGRLVLICSYLLSSLKRRQICYQLRGSRPTNTIFFVAGEWKEKLIEIQKTLLKKRLPNGWEAIQDWHDARWHTNDFDKLLKQCKTTQAA